MRRHRMGMQMGMIGLRRATLTRAALVVLLATTSLGCAVDGWAQGAPDAARTISIPEQELDRALVALGRATGRTIAFPPELVAGKRSASVGNAANFEDALARMLRGSGLRARVGGDGIVTIERVEARAAAPAAPKPAPTQARGDEPPPESITVTGTRLRGVQPAAPLRVLGREEIERSGFSQTGDLMRSLPENFNGGQNPGVIGANSSLGNGNSSNASTINLRGLGSDATLTLVNGRRLASDGIFRSSDVSGIPLIAIQRVEVVTDGSSAIYGSDAVAGVANFILRRNFDGAEASVRYGTATQGGGSEQTYSGIAGFVGADWHAMLSAEYSRLGEITAAQRNYTKAVTPLTSLRPPEQRKSLFFSGGKEFGESVTLSVDALLGTRDGQGASGFTASSMSFNDRKSWSYSVSSALDIALPQDWTLQVAGVVTRNVNNLEYSNRPASGDAYVNATRYVEATLSGTPLRLPTGDVRIAAGGGYREESYDDTPKNGGPLQSASLNVQYAFGEVAVPLVAASRARTGLHSLDFNLSGRVERYNTFGATTTPKLGLRYVPFDDVVLRATWGRSFKAPEFQRLLQSKAALVYPGTTFGAPSGTVFYLTGGNPDLQPEKSKSWTAGADWSPRPSTTISATFFHIDYTDRVVLPVLITPINGILGAPANARFITRNPTLAQQNAVIAAASTFSNLAGALYTPTSTVAFVDNSYANAAAQTSRGIDLSVRQDVSFDGNRVDLFANATWTDLKQVTTPGTPEVVLSGTVAAVPKFRARGGASWARGGFVATGAVNYVDHLTDNGVTPAAGIASWTTVDVNLSYEFPADGGALAGVNVALSATNLFDKNPPFAASPGALYPGLFFDSTNASSVGRFVALTVRKRF